MKMKKTLCLIMALAMVFGLLSACGGGDGKTDTETPEYTYVPTYTELSRDIGYVYNTVRSGDLIYFVGEVEGEPIVEQIPSYDDNGNPILDEEGNPVMEEYTYTRTEPAMFTVNIDGTDFKRMESYTAPEFPEEAEGGSFWINNLCSVPNGGVAVVENVYYSIPVYGEDGGDGGDTAAEDTPVATGAPLAATSSDISVDAPAPDTSGQPMDYQYVEKYNLRVFDASGAQTFCAELSSLIESEDYFYVSAFAVSGTGEAVLMANGNAIYVLNADGSLKGSIDTSDLSNGISNFVTLGDGSVAALVYGEDYAAFDLRPVDTAAMQLGEATASLPTDAYSARPSGGGYDFCYNKGESFYGYKLADGSEEKLVTWINCDVNSNNVTSPYITEEGNIVCLSSEYSNTGDGATTYFITLTKTPYDQVPQKTTLTLACVYLGYDIKNQILDFNRKSSDYRIEVRDYSEFNTEDDYSAGYTKLITEIGSGAVPDIMLTDGLPIETFGAKGLLADLWPFIDADEELGGRAGVVEPVFNALSQDGKLYEISSNFYITTIAGPASIVGTEPGWTYEEMYAALDQMPEGCELFSLGTTRSDVFSSICMLNLSRFVDWTTGECSFDSDDFISLMEFANRFPETFDWEHHEWTNEDSDAYRIKEGRQLLVTLSLSDPYSYNYYSEMFNGDMALKGFPDVPGSGAVFNMNGTGLAIASTCKNQDAAWSFVRTLLTREYQENYTYGFCTNRELCEENIQSMVGESYYSYDQVTGEEKEIIFTQENADLITDLINNTSMVADYNTSQINDIINEEVAYYFSGEKTAQDVAATIQNRVSIYVNEQR